MELVGNIMDAKYKLFHDAGYSAVILGGTSSSFLFLIGA